MGSPRTAERLMTPTAVLDRGGSVLPGAHHAGGFLFVCKSADSFPTVPAPAAIFLLVEINSLSGDGVSRSRDNLGKENAHEQH